MSTSFGVQDCIEIFGEFSREKCVYLFVRGCVHASWHTKSVHKISAASKPFRRTRAEKATHKEFPGKNTANALH